MWDLPLQTQRRLIEPIAGFHIQKKIISNTMGFYKRLKKKPKADNSKDASIDEIRHEHNNWKEPLLYNKDDNARGLHNNWEQVIQHKHKRNQIKS